MLPGRELGQTTPSPVCPEAPQEPPLLILHTRSQIAFNFGLEYFCYFYANTSTLFSCLLACSRSEYYNNVTN